MIQIIFAGQSNLGPSIYHVDSWGGGGGVLKSDEK